MSDSKMGFEGCVGVWQEEWKTVHGRGIDIAKAEKYEHALCVQVISSSSVWQKVSKAVGSQVERASLAM